MQADGAQPLGQALDLVDAELREQKGMIVASLFASCGLDALLANGPGRSLSGLAVRWATVAVAVGLVLIALDGFALQRIAEGWLQ